MENTMENTYYRIQQIYKSYPIFVKIINEMKNPNKKIKECYVLVNLLEYSKYTDKVEFHKEEKHYFQTQFINDEYITNIYYDDPNVNLIIIYEDNSITIGKEYGNYYKDYLEKYKFIENDFPEDVWKQIKTIKID